jgi:hypothetical protein
MLVEDVEDLVPEVDREFLLAKGYKFKAKRVGADVHIIIEDFSLPAAYAPRAANMLIVLPAGYPNANLDMFRTIPDVRLTSGAWPKNADARETHDGVSWQRWSRHFNSAWRQGVDNLKTFIASIKHELEKGI